MQGDGAFLLLGEHLGFFLQSSDDTVYCGKEILLLHLPLVVSGSDEGSLVAYVGDVGARESRCLACQQVDIYGLVELERFEVYAEYLLALVQVGEVNVYLSVETSGTQQCLVEDVHTVGGGEDDDTRVGAESVHLGEQLVQRVLALIVATHSGVLATGTAHCVNLVDKDDAGCLLLGLAEEIAYARCAHTDEHLHEVGA